MVLLDLSGLEHVRILSKASAAIFESSVNALRNPIIKSGLSDFIGHTFLVEGAVEVCTDERILDIAEEYCGSPVHLSNHRVYQNRSAIRGTQSWHKDNKLDFIDENSGEHVTQIVEEDKGLIMILYLSDVDVGGTEFILGSHDIENSREVFGDEEAHRIGPRIVADGLKSGSAILYDYRMIHRASSVRRTSHRRTSLFAQMSPNSMPAGEPIFLPSYKIDCLSSRQKAFLCCSNPPSAPNWPIDNTPAISRIKTALKAILR
ncbi:phytanoyl-CoA dioxygenase family protein [Gammaproteobacteria bacterium]|nr:phytanoyl-CoA dioxygenase family protein [Gammaproteobacteria bacterium]